MRRTNWVSFAIVAGVLLGLSAAALAFGRYQEHQAVDAWNAKDHQLAQRYYVRAATFLPWRDDLWEQAGMSAVITGDYANALLYLHKPHELSEEGWKWLGAAYMMSGDQDAALQAWKDGLQFYDSAALYHWLASLYDIRKEWDAERDALANQVRVDPNDASAHYRLGLLLSFLDTEKALDELTRASTLNPELDSAVGTMRSALNIASTQTDESQKLVTIGRALGLVQDWTLAAAAFQQAVALDAANAQAWAWLGEAEQQLGGDGSAALDQAIALDKESAIIRGLRGLQWNRMGDYDRMLAEYSLAARLEPQNPAWQAAMGEAHLKLGDLAAALDNYRRATELAPEEALYWRLLATTCAENGVAVEEVALPAAQKAAELSPKDPAAWDALGFTYFSSGRYANAEESLKTAIELDVNYYAAYIHLAMNYLTQGNNPAAYDALIYVRDHDAGAYAERAKEMLAQYFP